MSREKPVALDFEGHELEGMLVARRDGARRPGVLIFPTVMGVSELELGCPSTLGPGTLAPWSSPWRVRMGW